MSWITMMIFRFIPTSAHPPWSGILQAISYGPACPQQFPANLDNMTLALGSMTRQYWQYLTRIRDSVTHQAEDCLYLNIFRSTIAEQPWQKWIFYDYFLEYIEIGEWTGNKKEKSIHNILYHKDKQYFKYQSIFYSSSLK